MSTKTAVKITIGEKIVILREPSNGDIDVAMKMAHQEMGDSEDKMRYMVKMQQNLLKHLLVSVNGSEDVRKPLEDLFSLAEQAAVSKVLSKLTGLGNEVIVQEELITL